MSPARPPLWTCAACGRAFANRNQTHTCAPLDLEHHFVGREPRVRELFDAFTGVLRGFGPVTVLPEKTRIAFQVRMSFAQLTPRKAWLAGHLVLAAPRPDACFSKVETFSPRNHVHHFRLESPESLDRTFVRRMREAYAVGCQQHLPAPGRRSARG